ncbi:DUF4159 domain-containing protein [Parasulfitobacter algicola]|uniref:DUF4159 domain-containing protein n=1 Tax=Parasulfitobacter algicola TaxID=2614809 RepID=A0ABX2IPN6_9RHOB|nr:DUF4159 domain-containing protein [Sulfitobacter algicola]NSX54859.1 DUF4159 domain-containing protein [Sulfitobacter algicola]
MFTIGALGFTTPLLLLGLIVLPILWLLLRAVPPAPIRRRFPGVALLLGLQDDENQADKTPWWLLLLRIFAIAAVIIGFAGPVLNPQDERTGDGPLLIVADGTWADARDWPRRMDRIEALLDDAAQLARPVAFVLLSDPPEGDIQFQAADVLLSRLPSLQPNAWEPTEAVEWAENLTGSFETFWLSDGLERLARSDVLLALEARGSVTVFESPRPIYAIEPARFEDGNITLSVNRDTAGAAEEVTITAHGLDPAGVERQLALATADFEPGGKRADVALTLPPELRNRITRFEIAGLRSAGAVTLTDDALKRREVALIAGRQGREGLELLSPLHFLEQALEPTADLIDGTLEDVLLANPNVIILADVAQVSDLEQEKILEWLDNGGLLLRFAGPRLAASDVSRRQEDPLMPVRLRAGGRSVGGAMSWGEPKALSPFPETSPFFGLNVPDDVTISAQVMAQPDPSLSERVIASLADGTPLVTRKKHGQGTIVLFHVTANAEWSTIPLSGLFVEMLERLAISTRPAVPDAEELAGMVWAPDQMLSAFGEVMDATTLPGVEGETLAERQFSATMPPGLYTGDDRRIAMNVIQADRILNRAEWPSRITVEGLAVLAETVLKGAFLTGAFIVLLIDILASLMVSGRLTGPRATAAVVSLIACLGFAPDAYAQQNADADMLALSATSEVVLAHVVTGNDEIDRVAAAGLLGVSNTLFQRTSIEPARPIAVNLEIDELSFFPFLYWPITTDQPLPSVEAYAKLNRYLRTGGMILFDTRDANTASFGAASPNGRKLQQLAAQLDIPPLEPIPSDHVLTRTFYLLQDFPGRYPGRDVWVEAAPPDAEQIEGMPFRNLNDGVTPVVIGGNDWASAWAIDERGAPLFPVGRGYAGDRQREIAMRFGVNLIMHVLTGNYKSDQVHVPALLDRLGQ